MAKGNGELDNVVTITPRVVIEMQANGYPRLTTNLTLPHAIGVIANTLNTLIQKDIQSKAKESQILKPGEAGVVIGKG